MLIPYFETNLFMAVSQPQEHGENQENLKRLSDEICEAILELPERMEVTTEKGVRKVEVTKEQIYGGGKSYNVSGVIHTPPAAYLYMVEIIEGEKTLLTIKYKEPHKSVINLLETEIMVVNDEEPFLTKLREPHNLGESIIRDNDMELEVSSVPNKQCIFSASGRDPRCEMSPYWVAPFQVGMQITAQDIELLVSFLQKAVAQHEMKELKEAQAIEASQLKTAEDIRRVLRSL